MGEYSLDQDEYKVCSLCGGRVLDLQEAFDTILAFKADKELIDEW